MGLVNDYIATLSVDESEKQKIGKYLDLVKRRANGSTSFLLVAILHSDPFGLLGSLLTTTVVFNRQVDFNFSSRVNTATRHSHSTAGSTQRRGRPSACADPFIVSCPLAPLSPLIT